MTAEMEARLTRLLDRFPRHWQWIAFALVALWVEYLTGPYMRFPILFVLPVAFAAWHRGAGFACAFACVLSGLHAAVMVGAFASSLSEELSNAVVHLLVLAMLGVLLDALAARVRGLERRVEILTGLLPICMYCKRIRDPQGEWQRLESYISARSGASFSHGLCAECEAKYHAGL